MSEWLGQAESNLVSVTDTIPKGGEGVWYSCIHSNLQSVEFQRHESDWLSTT